jgi:hypothetical protein
MAEAAHQRFIATTWSVSPDDKERPVKKSIFRRCRSGRWHVAPSELRSIARRQGASREEELFLFFFFFFFFSTHTHIGRQGTPDGEAGLACEARITEWRTDRAHCFD